MDVKPARGEFLAEYPRVMRDSRLADWNSHQAAISELRESTFARTDLEHQTLAREDLCGGFFCHFAYAVGLQRFYSNPAF